MKLVERIRHTMFDLLYTEVAKASLDVLNEAHPLLSIVQQLRIFSDELEQKVEKEYGN